MAKGRPKKIALLGATGYDHWSLEAQVKSFPWYKLKKVTNLADYDVVTLCMVGAGAATESACESGATTRGHF